MSTSEFIATEISELPSLAKKFLAQFSGKKIFAFHGELGAGKTTFIKTLCGELGVNDPMSSPTFSIVNEYHDAKGIPVYHMDLYRIKSAEEAMNAGVEEYLNSGKICFIEWPEVIEDILPAETVRVLITTEGETRKLAVSSS
ncbi:MAG TPA: tRNA (adenosine(37)-N6)-threonylcarbamoyltransferase complex ATPase subunit type 1 TsaE [Bacteroidia bacterium]|jgi:tRNA threonylcarbamoyladenosine biosynthesis protein TsaE|nr:tRNA (adenosine(37)-N6)-threonylcarbamoyltransferase complex ATPase subunit type 1 TsaE [Bacteroidia bacterium]